MRKQRMTPNRDRSRTAAAKRKTQDMRAARKFKRATRGGC